MEIEYSLDLKDALAFTFNQAQRSTKKSKVWGFHYWLVMACILTVIVSISVKDPLYHVLLRDAAVMLCGACWGVVFAALRVRRAIRGGEEEYFKDPLNRFLFAPERLSIAAEEITIVSEGFRSYIPWKGVVDLVATADHVFFYTGSINAFLVPKRAFRDVQHFKEFVELAQRYYNGSSSKGEEKHGDTDSR